MDGNKKIVISPSYIYAFLGQSDMRLCPENANLKGCKRKQCLYYNKV